MLNRVTFLRSKYIFVVVGFTVIVLDQLSKTWALRNLGDGSGCTNNKCVDLLFGARFHLARNSGASFSFAPNFGVAFAFLGIIMSVVLGVAAYRETSRRRIVIYGLIVGGILGNIADRLFRANDGFLSGKVVDFIDFQVWPIFNIADSAIVVGIVLLVILSLREDTNNKAEAETDSEVAS
jgi:signal peptidase II